MANAIVPESKNEQTVPKLLCLIFLAPFITFLKDKAYSQSTLFKSSMT